MALPANLRETTQAHLESLIADQTQEGPHLDFKRELPAQWDNATKHEFLADVSAFANAAGGDLIYGIDEDGNAQAAAIIPQEVKNDEVVRRLLDFMLNLVEPRLPGVQVHPVAVSLVGGAGHVIVVRVPQSWAGPHRVKTNQHFYLREGARKRQLDVPEIRGLFLRSDNQAQHVRDFRTERISRILTGEAPHPLVPGAVFLMHLIPTEAALGNMQIDPVQYDTTRDSRARRLPMLARSGSGSPRLNLDGMMYLRNPTAEGTHGYSLLFRNGFLEATNVQSYPYDGQAGQFALMSYHYERDCMHLVDGFRTELRALGVDAEMTAMLSLLHADTAMLAFNRADFGLTGEEGRFDRKHLILPDVRLPPDEPAHQALRPVFDLIWQAAGLAGSINYDARGNYVVRGA